MPVLIPASRVILQVLRDLGHLPPLEDEGEAEPDWKGTYGGGMGTTPDQAVSISDTVPIVHGSDMRGGLYLKNPGVQVMVRCLPELYDEGHAKGAAIEEALEKAANRPVTVAGQDFVLQSFEVSTGLWNFGTEKETNRELFSVNGTCVIRNG
jgi:hypothetical protein